MSKQEEIEALKSRVCLGNEKLIDAWDQICKMDHNSQRWREELQNWHEANERLSALCTQLKIMGFNECLFLNDKGEKTKKCLEHRIGCRCCPSAKAWWKAEFMALPSGGD